MAQIAMPAILEVAARLRRGRSAGERQEAGGGRGDTTEEHAVSENAWLCLIRPGSRGHNSWHARPLSRLMGTYGRRLRTGRSGRS